MSLASLTVDLTLGLAKFEGDSGRAAQIATRDSERMTRAAKTVEEQLRKQADQVGRTAGEYLALQAAQAGLGETAQKLAATIDRFGQVSASAGGAASAAFSAASAAAQEAAAKQRALNTELNNSILQVNDAYRAQLALVNQRAGTGDISSAQQKSQQAQLEGIRKSSIEQLKVERDRQFAELQAAAVAAANTERQRVEAQKLIDQQNGLTASYRTQLAALRELRDAGQLSPAQFKQAGTDLVNRQPAVQQRAAAATQSDATAQAAAAAEAVATEKRTAAFEKLRQTVEKLNFNRLTAESEALQRAEAAEAEEVSKRSTATERLIATVQRLNYDKQITDQARLQAASEATATAEAAATAKRVEATQRLIASVQKLNYQQQAADAEKLAAAIEAEAAVEKRAAEDRASAAQRVIDQQNGLTASYRTQLAALRELRDAGAISPAQFKQAGTELVQQQPVSREAAARLREQQAAVEAEAKSEERAAAQRQAFIDSIERQAEAIGKSRTQLLAEEAARQGVSGQVAPFIEKIRQAEQNLNKYGTTSKVTAFQLQQLHYTLSDVIASAASGISPLTILAQQGGQLNDAFNKPGGGVFGGFSEAIKAVIGLLTPMRVVIGGVVATIGTLVYAFAEGSKQSKEFADAIVLTGNYAGLTEGQFNKAAKAIAASGQVSISTAREYAQALAATGQVGPEVFGKAAEAAARFGQATGKSAKDVATDFAAMGDDAAKWVIEHNKSLNLFSQAEILHIKELQDGGKAIEAQTLIYDKLNERLKNLEPNLGTLDRALRAVKGTWAEFWDAAFDIGRAQTIEDKIKDAQARLEQARRQRNDAPSIGPYGGPRPATGDATVDARAEDLRLLQRSQAAKESTAAETAEIARLNKEAAGADEFVKGFEKRAKAADGLARELANANAEFAKQDRLAARDPAYAEKTKGLRSPDTRAAIVKKINEDYTDKPAANEDRQTALKKLEGNLKREQDLLDRAKTQLSANQQQLDAIYQNGELSLDDYYARRRAIINEGTADEIRAAQNQQELLRKALADPKFTDKSDREGVQNKLNDAIEREAKVRTSAANATTLAGIEEQRSFQALADKVTTYRAQLAQLEGDEVAAAALRQQQAIAAAGRLQRESGGTVSEEDVARQARALQLSDAFAEVQRRVAQATQQASTAEEAFVLRSQESGAGLIETERGVYQIRSAALSQLGELADKARELAAASTDPKILQFAEELALQYQRAAAAVDPALNRLKAASDQLAGDLGSSLTESITDLDKLYAARREKAAQDTANQRADYTRQIDDLRGSLKNISNAKDRAQVQDRIKQLEAQRAQVGDQNVFLKTLERDVIGPAADKVRKIGIKLFIEEPLEDLLRAEFKKAIAANGSIVDFLKKGLGVGSGKGDEGIDAAAKGFSAAKDTGLVAEKAAEDAQAATATAASVAATEAQTAAVSTSTIAVSTMSQAAEAAASALLRVAASSSGGGGFAGLFGAGSGGGGFGTGADYGNVDYGAFLADGTNYVPYDGFKATLHKGEEVTPAKYNPSAGGRRASGGGQTIVQLMNQGAPLTATSQSESTDANGTRTVRLMIDALVNDVSAGGRFASAMETKYSVRRNNPRRN